MLRIHDPVARFEERITEDENGCWIWQGKIGTNGRAVFKVNARTISVHRWAYEHYRGPIPDGLVLDHLCKTPLCVNPDHLEAVTVLENNKRARTHCFRGHPFDDENTALRKEGKRLCRICEMSVEPSIDNDHRRNKPGSTVLPPWREVKFGEREFDRSGPDTAPARSLSSFSCTIP